FRVDLSPELKRHGIHDAFHASKLKIHIPNEDRRFPAHHIEQILGLRSEPKEWAVDKVLSHCGKGASAMFQVQWRSGDTT
ncbi:hypothetical protein GLOTRDRAFT_20634, partial [Gloeophyllum trabeum ATCC 11539]